MKLDYCAYCIRFAAMLTQEQKDELRKTWTETNSMGFPTGPGDWRDAVTTVRGTRCCAQHATELLNGNGN